MEFSVDPGIGQEGSMGPVFESPDPEEWESDDCSSLALFLVCLSFTLITAGFCYYVLVEWAGGGHDDATFDRDETYRLKIPSTSIARGTPSDSTPPITPEPSSKRKPSGGHDDATIYRDETYRLRVPSAAIGSGTPSDSTPPITPEPSSKRKPRSTMSDTTLICTVTASGPDDPLALPTDGLCDFVFYESLYAGQTKPDTLIDDVPSPRLKSFIDAASTSVLTDYGCAVDINYHREFATDLEDPKGKTRIVELWNQNVFHYGFLTLDQYRSDSAAVMAALNNLKAVTSAVREATGGEALTALGLFIKLGDVSACANVSYFVKTIFTPTALVVLAHISYQDNAFNTCRIIPAMMYQVPLKYLAVMKYGHAFIDTVAPLQCVKKNLGAQRTTSLAISVSLKGRRYKPLSPDTDPNIIGTFDLFNYCSGDSSYDQTAPSAQLCELTGSYKQHLTYNTAYQAVVTYDKTEGFTIIFENEDSIRKKVCDAAGAYPLKPFSLAAYDVNFDAGVSSCPSPGTKGDFSRLRIVRGLIQYVLDPPKATTACEAVS